MMPESMTTTPEAETLILRVGVPVVAILPYALILTRFPWARKLAGSVLVPSPEGMMEDSAVVLVIVVLEVAVNIAPEI